MLPRMTPVGMLGRETGVATEVETMPNCSLWRAIPSPCPGIVLAKQLGWVRGVEVVTWRSARG